jgi:hypothetical protein
MTTYHELSHLYSIEVSESTAMKSSFLQLALASTALAASNISLPNGWFTIPPAAKITHDTFHGQPRYLTWMADSQIKHGVNPTHDYFVSALLSGVKLAYDRTHDAKYLEFIEKHVSQTNRSSSKQEGHIECGTIIDPTVIYRSTSNYTQVSPARSWPTTTATRSTTPASATLSSTCTT